MTMSTDAQLARLDERLNSLDRVLSSIAEEQRAAAEGRRRMYEGLEGLRGENQRASESWRTENLKLLHRLSTLEETLKAIRPTTDELERVRTNVVFAGTLGKALWSFGKQLIAAAAGAVAAYYWMTGKTPP